MFRKTVSMTSLVSFVVLLLTSVVLYYEPHGRVAYWGGWTFLGLSKENWDAIHITVGVLFLAAIGLHIWLNWKPIMNALKNKARQFKFFTPPMALALGLTLFVGAGTLLGLPPMQQVLDFSSWLKDGHTSTYGNPPYGHAEQSTLTEFARIMGLDLEQARAALDAQGMVSDPEAALEDIAKAAGVTPRQVYDVIKASRPAGADPFAALPPTPPEGTGKLTLAQLAESFGLDVGLVMERLSAQGLKPAPDKTIKQLADEAGLEPVGVYQLLRNGE